MPIFKIETKNLINCKETLQPIATQWLHPLYQQYFDCELKLHWPIIAKVY